ncbi:hypothetical protein BPT24_235 [Tenacibaculum phage pT24]|uniref:Uncharacterized protein n=1 Tax=Tenacibaculum phage pT24 TaxID=1880590 RepID=A0A1B4XX19_9CAUD|nr:hypothetical protein HYP10_gp293 [Tenacibaculum phage pT24]BAV39355.1 hypothetical protein BPT24_235 [Tenacibaculum phage pT24]
MNFPTEYETWLKTNRSIITFSAKNGKELLEYETLLKSKGVQTYRFYEPDYNQITGIGIVPSDQARKMTSSLKLFRHTQQEMYFDEVTRDMSRTEQMDNLSVLQHGEMVHDYYKMIVSNQMCNLSKFEKVPKWLLENKAYILNELSKFDFNAIKDYQIMHDLGKPYCIQIDENGRRHFPNHAQVSYDTWKKLNGDPFVGNLILNDMKMHTMKASDIEDFMKIEGYLILMVTSVAELYANAEMFGGYESTSFKIKFKQLEKRGNAIFRIINESK